jgi:hypothetical protein
MLVLVLMLLPLLLLLPPPAVVGAMMTAIVRASLVGYARSEIAEREQGGNGILH